MLLSCFREAGYVYPLFVDFSLFCGDAVVVMLNSGLNSSIYLHNHDTFPAAIRPAARLERFQRRRMIYLA